MKTSLKLLVGAALLATSMAGFAAYPPGAGITGTPHDWSSANGTTLLLWLDSKGAQTTYNTGVRRSSDPATGKASHDQGHDRPVHEVPYAAPGEVDEPAVEPHAASHHVQVGRPCTTAGTAYATFQGDTYKGPTTKCLSCHDGLLSSTDGMWFNRAMTSGSKYVCARRYRWTRAMKSPKART